jgi:hypothetical protein
MSADPFGFKLCSSFSIAYASNFWEPSPALASLSFGRGRGVTPSSTSAWARCVLVLWCSPLAGVIDIHGQYLSRRSRLCACFDIYRALVVSPLPSFQVLSTSSSSNVFHTSRRAKTNLSRIDIIT